MVTKVPPTVNTANTSQANNNNFSSSCLVLSCLSEMLVVLGLLHGARYVLLVCTIEQFVRYTKLLFDHMTS